jgi:hypothetical protein
MLILKSCSRLMLYLSFSSYGRTFSFLAWGVHSLTLTILISSRAEKMRLY